jgi:hypothetical protein
LEFPSNPLPEFLGQYDTVFHRNPLQRDEWAYVRSAQARVFPVVLRHINVFRSRFYPLEGRFHDLFRWTGEGEDRAMGCFSRIYVEKVHPGHGPDSIGDLPDHLGVPAFAEIGDAFHPYRVIRQGYGHHQQTLGKQDRWQG